MNFYPSNSTTCTAATAKNCYTYASITACATCDPNDLQKVLTTDASNNVSCLNQNIPNCYLPTQTLPTLCSVCNIGFYLNSSGGCSAATSILNCVAYSGQTTCARCKPTYVLSADKSSCNGTTFVLSIDPNCNDSQLSSSPFCAMCSPSYYFINSTCTACTNNTATNGCYQCNPYNQTSCLACLPGFYQDMTGNCNSLAVSNVTNTTSGSPIVKVFALLFALVVFLM